MRTRTSLLAGAVISASLLAPTAALAQDAGTVTVLHGVPGLTVYVNGDLTLEDFTPGTVTDPLELPAGDYDLAVRAADASIIAHLDDAGPPTLGVFVNDTSPADTYSAEVRLAGETDPVLGPADVALDEGTATYVYAIGSAEEGSLDLLVQTIGGLHAAPEGVPAGDAP